MASEDKKVLPEDDCGIITACDKGDDDSQLEYLEY